MNDSNSSSGYVFTLVGAVVSWKFFKQIVITISIMKFEIITLNKHGEEVEWL